MECAKRANEIDKRPWMRWEMKKRSIEFEWLWFCFGRRRATNVMEGGKTSNKIIWRIKIQLVARTFKHPNTSSKHFCLSHWTAILWSCRPPAMCHALRFTLPMKLSTLHTYIYIFLVYFVLFFVLFLLSHGMEMSLVRYWYICEVGLLENGYQGPTRYSFGDFSSFYLKLSVPACVRVCACVQVRQRDLFLHIIPSMHAHTIHKDRLLTFETRIYAWLLVKSMCVVNECNQAMR